MAKRCEWFWPGEDFRVPVDDRGLTFADGAFETLRVTARGAVLLDRHRDRLLNTCRLLEIPFTAEDFAHWQEEAAARGLLDVKQGADRVLRLTVTRGSGGRGYGRPDETVPRVITTTRQAPPTPQAPVRVQMCRYPVQVPSHRAGLKTLERLDQVMASRELRADVFEGLMPDIEGRVVEGTRSNLFLLLSDNNLVTPPAHALAVRGTLRDWLISELPGQGYRVREASVSLSMLQRARGVAMVNSVFGVVPVDEIDGIRLHHDGSLDGIRHWAAKAIGLTT